ncbi:MAG: DUF305 domain-containing protein [Cellulosilyticaceae bacterium]
MNKVFCALSLFSLSLYMAAPLVAEPPSVTKATETHEDSCEYFNQYKKIYCTMKNKMLEAPITKNATEDFLFEMIPHHEAAVAMAKNILKYTDHAEIASLAQSIIKEQAGGILKMKALLFDLTNSHTTPKDDDYEYIKSYEQIIHTMFTKMATPPISCDVNIMFLDEMIPHHEGAIAMAENILKYTTNPELKKIATQILDTQKKQLPQMQTLLSTLIESDS